MPAPSGCNDRASCLRTRRSAVGRARCPTLMRAAFCTAPETIALRDVPWPQVTTRDEVVVQVHACGICGSDLHYYKGAADAPAVCLGHEICGRVIDGPGDLAGAAVVVEPLLACGRCRECRSRQPN